MVGKLEKAQIVWWTLLMSLERNEYDRNGQSDFERRHKIWKYLHWQKSLNEPCAEEEKKIIFYTNLPSHNTQ